MDSSRKMILVSFAVGAVIVAVAFYLKPDISDEIANDTNLAVVATSDVGRARIEVADSDGDGVPDWQEALHRDDPIVIEEVSADYTPETLTEQFSIDFFQDMMISRNIGEFGRDPEEIAEFAVDQMTELAVDRLYGSSDIVLSTDNSTAAIEVYANTMAQIVLDQGIEEGALNEAEILKQAYTLDNPELLKELGPIIAGYKEMIDRSLLTPVPSSYAKEHLDVINVYNAIYNDAVAMSEGFTDPIKTIARLKRYEEDATSLYVVLLNLQKKMILDGTNITESDPAYRFIVQ